jgi:type I restriction enzyme, S subunit
MKQFSKIKESDVDWIGKIPSDWSTKKLKFSINHRTQKSKKNSSTLPYVGLENVETKTGILIDTNEEMEESDAKVVLKNDVLFGKLRPYLAKVVKINFDARCSGEFLVMEGRDYEPDFLKYLLLSDGAIKRINASTYGAKMPRAEWTFIGNMRFPTMSKNTQKNIINFLKLTIPQLHSCIKNHQNLIELLQQKRQATINRVVLEGLDPNISLKDSKFKLIKKIPVHWDIHALKHFIKISICDGPHTTPEFVKDGIPFLSVDSIQDDKLFLENPRYISKEDHIKFSKKCKPMKNDILLGKAASVGKVAIVETDIEFNIWSPLAVIRLKNKHIPKFYYYFMRSNFFQDQIMLNVNFNTQGNIGMDDISNLQIVDIPNEEQKQIVDYLEKIVPKIDVLISNLEKQILKLQEYYQLIISKSVTGKIDTGCA